MNDDTSGPLKGLEDVPWDTFGAVGREVPAALKRLATGDGESALDAVRDLGDTLTCTGSVSDAAPFAIPYMVRLAASGLCSVGLLDLLGAIAMDAVGAGRDAAREVLANNAVLLRPLLDHEDPEVREGAVLVLSTAGAGADLSERFVELWASETNSRVRVSLVFGSARTDRDLAIRLTQDAASDRESDDVRIASLVAGAEIGLPWSEERTTTLLRLLPFEERLGQTPWTDKPLDDLVLALARRSLEGQREAVDLTTRALAFAEAGADPAVLYEAVWAAQSLGDEVRATRTPLRPALARLANSPVDKSRVTEGVLKAWGSSAV